jgi:S1-C subfamily serine protease
VRLGERPAIRDEPTLATAEEEVGAGNGTVHESPLGMDVQNLTPRMRQTLVQRLNLDSDRIPEGVYIRDVESLGAAQDAGIGEGGIVTQIGDTPVRNLEEYRAAVAALEPGQIVYFRIYYPQGDSQLFRALRVPR